MTAVAPNAEYQGGTYTFTSQPRAVPQRKKYRDDGPAE